MASDATPTPVTPPSPSAVPARDPRTTVRVSPSFRRLVVVGGPVLIVAGVVLALARPGASAWWGLLGAGAALVIVATRATASDRTCAFCGVEREQVPFLVTGPTISICPACAAAASAKTAEELDRRGQLDEWTRLFLNGLPERAPLALSRPYVERVIEGDRSPDGVRASIAWCFRFGHHRLAQGLLDSIPEAARTPVDWINLAFALGEQGLYREALAATRRASPPGGGPADPWMLANAAWYELRLQPDASRGELARWLAQVVEARRLLTARAPAAPHEATSSHQGLASFHGIEAELLRRMGDAEGALRALAEADGHAPATGERLVIRAHALADLGRPGEAHAEAERALSALRPDSPAAEDARQLAGAPPPR